MNKNPIDAEKQLALALCYYSGDGVPQNSEKAIYWLTKAAEQGNEEAQCALGVAYAQGDGVPQSYQEASYWWTRAANQGNAMAQNNLRKLNS